MRHMILLCITSVLCSCGASGKLLGSAVRLPARIITGGKKFNNDKANQYTPTLPENNDHSLSDIN